MSVLSQVFDTFHPIMISRYTAHSDLNSVSATGSTHALHTLSVTSVFHIFPAGWRHPLKIVDPDLLILPNVGLLISPNVDLKKGVLITV